MTTVRRVGMLAAIVLTWSFFLLVRFGGVYGNFSSQMSYRWTLTADEEHEAAVQSFADARQTVRTTVRLIDRLQTGQRSPGQRDQQLLPPDLGRIMVQRGQHPVHQTDPVPSSTALHETRLPCPFRRRGRPGRCPVQQLRSKRWRRGYASAFPRARTFRLHLA